MSTTSTVAVGDNARPLPEPIVHTLRRVIHRVRAVVLIRGLLAVCAIAVGALLAVMAVDASVTIFSGVTRRRAP